MKELKFEELTTEQKLGMTHTVCLGGITSESDRYGLELIRKRCAGAVWINPVEGMYEEIMAAVKEAADYPILIVCDAESGIGEYLIGMHNALGCTGSEELAYTFGKLTGITARKMGYNVICNPLLDMAHGNHVCGGNVRSIGNDMNKVASLAAAEARGLHDGGVLTVGKHYPGTSKSEGKIDSHMGEVVAEDTVEELFAYNLQPYFRLMEENLLDGIMVRHGKYVNIDPKYPASLSKKVMDIIRDWGYDGFMISDALCMMGIMAEFGERESKGLAIAQGIDLALPACDNRLAFESICEYYEKGMISDERLDEAARRILEAQHKTVAEPKYTEITDEDIANYNRINSDSVYAKTDDGVPVALSREGRHFFAVLTDDNYAVSGGEVMVDTLGKGWYRPDIIIEKLEKLFPNSTTYTMNQFPTQEQNIGLLEKSLGYDDVVFITFFDSMCYIGRECLTSRVVSAMEAMQTTGRISTVVHFGNPYVLEELPHFSRVIIGTASTGNIESALDVLAGEYPAKGVLTYDVKLK